MSRDLRYPIRLNKDYPCQGIDAEGQSVTFDDLLHVGEKVGPVDAQGNVYATGIVVRRGDSLWVVQAPAHAEAHGGFPAEHV